MKKVAIIAMGNPSRSDDGIGARVVAELQQTALSETVDMLDLGTSGMNVLHELEGRDKVVFVDCTKMGEPPGTMRRFTPDDVATRKEASAVSLHEGDLLHTLWLARRLGTCPADVVIFGIEPKSLDFGENLSPELSDRLADYIAGICAEIAAPRG